MLGRWPKILRLFCFCESLCESVKMVKFIQFKQEFSSFYVSEFSWFPVYGLLSVRFHLCVCLIPVSLVRVCRVIHVSAHSPSVCLSCVSVFCLLLLFRLLSPYLFIPVSASSSCVRVLPVLVWQYFILCSVCLVWLPCLVIFNSSELFSNVFPLHWSSLNPSKVFQGIPSVPHFLLV